MINIQNGFALVFPAASVIAAVTSIFLFLRYRTPLAVWGVVYTLSVSLYLASYFLVLTGATPEVVRIGFRFHVTQLACVAFTWLFLVFIFTRHAHWIHWRAVLAWGAIPALLIGTALTMRELDPSAFIRGREVLGSLLGLTRDAGWLGYLFIGYIFIVVLFSMALLLMLIPKTDSYFRLLTLTLCAGLSITLLGLILDVAEIHPFSPVPNSQVGFLINSLFSFFVVYALRAGGTLPLGRSLVFEYINDAVVVLDHNDSMVDINPVAEQIIGRRKMESLGLPITRIWPQSAQFITGRAMGSPSEGEYSILVNDLELTFDVKISPVIEPVSQDPIGRVIVLRNVTGRERMEIELKQHTRELARTNRLITTLSTAASVIGATRDTNSLLDLLGKELKTLDLNCGIVSIDPGGEAATIKYVSLDNSLLKVFEKFTSFSLINHVIPRKYWPGDRILKGKEPIWYTNPVEYLRRMFPHVPDGIARKVGQALGVRSIGQLCILPLRVGEQLIGAMVIWGVDLHPEDNPVLALFANQVAGIFQNATVRQNETLRANELSRSNSTILALSKVAAQWESSSESTEIFAIVGKELKKLGMDSLIGMLDESKQNMQVKYLSVAPEVIRWAEKMTGHSLDALVIPRHLWPTDRVVTEKTVYWDPNLMRGTLDLFPLLPRSLHEKAMTMSGIHVDDPVCYLPIANEHDVTGVLAVWGAGLRSEDTPALSVFASQVANAITNRRLYELARAEIVERTRVQQQLAHDALHDFLTGLPNRTLFVDRLSQRLERYIRHPQYPFAVLFLDVDHFKDVNDGLGHMVGDQLLIAVGQRLQQCIRSEDTVSRLGGDEFGILVNEIRDVGEVLHIAERIGLRLISTALLVDVKRATTVSIGITISSGNYSKPFEFLRDADTAMYRAKSQGGNRYQLFDEAMYTDVIHSLEMEGELKRAVDNQEWQVHYQPILTTTSGHIAGVEALVRWEHPQRGMVSPIEFIKLAEERGLIVPIGEHVLRTASAQVKRWRDHGHPDLWVSVNLSGRQFNDPYLLRMIENILNYTGLPGDGLRLEVTESVAMKNLAHTSHLLTELSKFGIQVSLDDFGTGYSSLEYLNRLPLNILKIDRSFIKDLESNRHNKAITSAIISLGHNLNLEVVAEGVETLDQLAFLRSQFCDKVQGYLFSRPKSAQDLAEWMETTSNRSSLLDPGLNAGATLDKSEE